MSPSQDHIANVHRFADREALSIAAVRCWQALCIKAIDSRGGFHVALAGGSTPQRLYQLLVAPENSAAIPWHKVHIYFGDERAVPAEHQDSNYRMACEALLDHVPIPTTQIHRMRATPETIADDALAYAEILRQHVPQTDAGRPQFDLILLGMGADGHTASLFPGTAAVDERIANVTSVFVPRLQSWRLSLTLPVLNSARQLLFLVGGADKAETLRQVFSPPTDAPLPVQHIAPQGACDWYLDRDAAAALPAI